MASRANLWLVVVSSLIAIVAGVLGLEWAVRYREAHRTDVPGTMPFLFYRQYRMGYALVRGADYYGWVHVNRQGFRGREVELVPAPGVVRIMAVGASTTMDALAGRDENAWPARLEHWLNEAGGGRKFEVINAGVSGYRAIDNVIRLQTELYRYEPHLIIFYPAHNDLLGALVTAGDTLPRDEGARPGELPATAPWTRWLENHSLLYNKVLLRSEAIGSRTKGGERQQGVSAEAYDRAIARGAADFGRDLTAFVVLAEAANIPVALPQWVHLGGAGQPAADTARIAAMWRTAVPFAPPDVMLRGYAQFDSVTRAVARARGVPYIETAGFGVSGLATYADGDPVHFNERGADQMGRMVAETLLRLTPWAPATSGERGRGK